MLSQRSAGRGLDENELPAMGSKDRNQATSMILSNEKSVLTVVGSKHGYPY